MKTAAIVYDFPSLSETFVLGQITGLIEAGCDIRIFADGRDPSAPELSQALRARVRYFGLPFKRARERLGIRKSSQASLGKNPRTRDSISGAAASSHSKWRLMLEGRAFLGDSRFDVVHAHFGPNGVRAVRLRSMGVTSGPVLTSFYGYDVGRHWARGGYDDLFAHGDLFIALSNHMRDALVLLGCPRDRIRIHQLGVDLERFKPGRRTDRSRLEISSIARLVPKKGIEYGLDAIAELVRRKIPVRYTIVGTGMLQSKLEHRMTDLGIADHVRFLGPRSPADVVEILGDTDVLLAPSVTAPDGDIEGTPVAILEAQACGVPVVSTRHAGIPEIVRDGESGYLADERDAVGMADLLERCADSAAHRAAMGDAGRAIVAEHHDIRKLNRRLLDIYGEIRA